MGSGNCVARVHVENGVPPAYVREGMVISTKNNRQIVLLNCGAKPVVKEDTPEPKKKGGKKQ